jgi:hypothetical protein
MVPGKRKLLIKAVDRKKTAFLFPDRSKNSKKICD